MRLKSKSAVSVLVGALALAGAGSASSFAASSAPDTVTAIPSLSGVGTSVKLDAGTAKALTSLGVAVAPAGNATFDAGTSTITFPITSGYAEIHSDLGFKPGYIAGSIQHFGSGFTLTAGPTQVALTDFVVDPGNSILYGSVGGAPKIPLLSLDGTAVKVSMDSGNVVLDGTVAKLTDTAVGALNKAFATTALKAGTPLGTVHLVAKAEGATKYDAVADKTTEISRLTGKSTSVKLDAGTAKALGDLGVAVAPTGSGTFDAKTSTVGFPITGGFAAIHSDHNYKPGYIAGVVIHQGSGLKFSKGDTALEVSDFVVDPGNSILTATAGGKSGIPLLALDGTNVKVSKDGSDVVLDGTVAKLTGPGAAALNATFGVTAFTEGLSLGTVHLVASGS